MRAKIQEKNAVFLKSRVKYLQACLNASTEVAKEKHNTLNKLVNTQKNCEVYWSLLKIFLNNKKIPFIPPLFYENHFITDFKEKAEHFNFYFSKQYSLILNNSSLPGDANYITDKRLSTVTFSAEDIGRIIQDLDSSEGYGHNISIHILKICGDSICIPFEMIFNIALLTCVFPSD